METQCGSTANVHRLEFVEIVDQLTALASLHVALLCSCRPRKGVVAAAEFPSSALRPTPSSTKRLQSRKLTSPSTCLNVWWSDGRREMSNGTLQTHQAQHSANRQLRKCAIKLEGRVEMSATERLTCARDWSGCVQLSDVVMWRVLWHHRMADVFIQHFFKHNTSTLPRQLVSAYLRAKIRPIRIRNCTIANTTPRQTSSY